MEKIRTIRELAELLSLENTEMVSSFRNVCVLLKLFLTLPVTSASAERSFSKLKLIKTFIRSSMGQTRVRGLSVLSIEGERASTIDHNDVIKQVANAKKRKAMFM